jgi:hypothetical protein
MKGLPMFELFLIACVGPKLCDYITAPIPYHTVERCQQQAAIIAGQVRGRAAPGLKLEFETHCEPRFSVAVHLPEITTK